MKYSITEQKALKKLDIQDFRYMTKDKIVQFMSMIPQMDPEVAKAAIDKFPEFKSMAVEMTKTLSDIIDKTFAADKDSQNAFYEASTSVLDTLNEQLRDEKYSESERAAIRDNIMQILNMINLKDTEHKHLINSIFTKALFGIGTIIVSAIALLGGNVSLPFGKDD